jgi:ribonuclease Z
MLREILNLQLSVSNTKLKYEIHYNYLDDETESVILKDHNVEVTATPVDHRIPCFGFIFRETEKPLNIKKDSLQSFKLGVEEIKLLKQGKDIHRAKETIYAADATEAPLSLRKYAFITDTKPKESYYEAIKDSDILYHESTFMGDATQRAADTFHTTNLQAAEIALKTNCKKLVLGHFSTRYTQLEPIKAEAQTIFENTELAIEGTTFKIER